jgi:hypothetical protein
LDFTRNFGQTLRLLNQQLTSHLSKDSTFKQLITFNPVLITLDFEKLAGGASGVRAVAKLISYFA